MTKYTHATNEEGETVRSNLMFASGIGVATPDAMTAEQALKSAGLDFTVELRDNGFLASDGLWREDKTRKTVVRTDTEMPLGNVGRAYRTIQNTEMFEWCDRLVDDYGAKYEAAWSMHGGREVGLTMKFPDTVMIGGVDPHDKYLLLRGRHDGKGSVLALATDVRLWCTNMLNVAAKAATNRVTIAHRTNAAQKLAAARETFELTFKYQEAFEDEMEKLIAKQLTDDAFKQITDTLLAENNWGGRDAHGAAIVQLRKDSTTLQDEFRTTAYGAFQAITEWTDWVRPTSGTAQGRANDMLSGRVVRLKNASLLALAG